MQTCKIMQCEYRDHCNLEASGAVDLCPVLKKIVNEAKDQTDRDWLDKTSTQDVVQLDRYTGTVRTVCIGFTLELALSKLAAQEAVRRDATLTEMEQSKKYNTKSTTPRKQKGTRQTWGRKKTIPVHTYPWVKAESYSIYEYDTTPPAVPKTLPVMTRQDVFDRANAKENNRILNIKASRKMKLERLMGMIMGD